MLKQVLIRPFREPLRFVGALLLILTFHTWHDPDIWYHLNLGRSVWEQRSASPITQFLFAQTGFINVYWLFQLIVYGLFSLGEIIVTHLLFVATWLTMAILWVKRVNPSQNGLWAFVLALISVLVIQTRISARPDILLMLLLFSQALIYDSAFKANKISQKHFFGIWGLQVLAVNMQPYFVVAYLLGICFLIADSFKRHEFSKPALQLFVGLIFSSFVSPFGWKVWVIIYHYFSVMGEMNSVLMELQPPQFRHALEWAYWFLLATTLIAIGFAFIKKRQTLLLQILFALLGCGLSVMAQRNIPFVILFAAPLWGDLLKESKLKMTNPLLIGAAVICISVLSYLTVTNQLYTYLRVTKRFGIGLIMDQQPYAAVNWLQSQNVAPMRIFNEPNYGGYLAWRMPNQRWFADSRYTEPAKVMRYFKALNDRATFDELNNEYGFEAILVNKTMSAALAPSLWDDPNWRPVYQDATNAIVVRRTPEPPK